MSWNSMSVSFGVRRFERKAVACFAAAGVWAAAGGCQGELTGPSPAVDVLNPQIVCTDLTTPVILHGSGLSTAVFDTLTDEGPAVQLPQVALIHELDLQGDAAEPTHKDIPDDPTDPSTSRLRWMSQQQMIFDTFPELQLEPGVYGVEVTNANDNTALLHNALLAVPPPVLDAVVADLICTADGSRVVELQGSGFLFIDSDAPSVAAGALTLVPTEVECITLPGPVDNVRMCTKIEITLPAGSATGKYPVTVANPAPAGCVTSTPIDLFIVAPPAVASIEPMDVCLSEGDVNFAVTGSDFLLVDGRTPMVTFTAVAGSAATLGNVQDLIPTDFGGCVDYPGPVETVSVCNAFTLSILKQDSIATATTTFDVVVENPDPAGCVSDAIQITDYQPPTIDTVKDGNDNSPAALCQGGGTLVVAGSALHDGATVALHGYDAGGGSAGSIAVNGNCSGACSELVAHFGLGLADLIDAATVDVEVTNAGGCVVTKQSAVEVNAGPLVLYADPPIAYNGFANTITVYATNFMTTDISYAALASADDSFDDIVLCDDASAKPCSSVLDGSLGGVGSTAVAFR